MTHFGYTAMGEQVPAKQLVTDLVAAELAGFDFSVMSDHFSPWIEEQGHSPNAWVVLGAAAQATQALPLMTFVTCPTFRYHPVVVAQQAATLGVLSSGRFTLGLGAGENLNEHVIGGGWPMGRVRQERLAEAVEIIRSLFTGDYVNFSGPALPGGAGQAVRPTGLPAAHRHRRIRPQLGQARGRAPASCGGGPSPAGM